MLFPHPSLPHGNLVQDLEHTASKKLPLYAALKTRKQNFWSSSGTKHRISDRALGSRVDPPVKGCTAHFISMGVTSTRICVITIMWWCMPKMQREPIYCTGQDACLNQRYMVPFQCRVISPCLNIREPALHVWRLAWRPRTGCTCDVKVTHCCSLQLPRDWTKLWSTPVMWKCLLFISSLRGPS